MAPQVWFITGASNGMGLSMTEHLLENSQIVVAAVRKPELLDQHTKKYGPKQLLVVKVDVQKSEDIDAAFKKAGEVFGRIDVVHNNAGYSAVGEVEAMPIKDARDMFDTNFFGAAQVTLAAVKFLREVNKPAGGRIIQASSIYGLVAGGATGYYAASKYALEGLTESIAAEIDPAWNIKISLAEMGFFRTNFVKNHTYTVYSNPAYSNPNLIGNITRGMLENVDPSIIKGDPDKLAKRLFELSQLEDPPLRVLLGAEGPAMLGPKLQKDEELRNKYASWADGLAFDE